MTRASVFQNMLRWGYHYTWYIKVYLSLQTAIKCSLLFLIVRNRKDSWLKGIGPPNTVLYNLQIRSCVGLGQPVTCPTPCHDAVMATAPHPWAAQLRPRHVPITQQKPNHLCAVNTVWSETRIGGGHNAV